MTDKKPKVNSLAYTELSIQISTLEMKIDKVLDLLNKPEPSAEIQPFKIAAHDHIHVGVGSGSTQDLNNPPQWSNESLTDYLKRIGQYVEASSGDEQFSVDFK